MPWFKKRERDWDHSMNDAGKTVSLSLKELKLGSYLLFCSGNKFLQTY